MSTYDDQSGSGPEPSRSDGTTPSNPYGQYGDAAATSRFAVPDRSSDATDPARQGGEAGAAAGQSEDANAPRTLDTGGHAGWARPDKQAGYGTDAFGAQGSSGNPGSSTAMPYGAAADGMAAGTPNTAAREASGRAGADGGTGRANLDPYAAAGAGYGSSGSANPYTTGSAYGSGNTGSNPYTAGADAPATHTGGPYTSAPATPAGYDFSRSSAASTSSMASNTYPGEVGADRTTAQSYDRSQPYDTLQPMSAVGTVPDAGGERRERRRGPGWGGVILTSVLVALLACGGTFAALRLTGQPVADPTSPDTAPTAIATGSTTQTVTTSGTTPDWEAVTAAVSNAVVSITVKVADGTAVGSGVVYDADGHILTNHHVVSTASRIQVTLADGRIYEARLTGSDPATDLAVVQLENSPSDLTVAQFGDSSTLVAGQDVMAIGNPLGLSSTATTGIISALDRPVVTTQEDQGDGSTPGLPGGDQGGGQDTRGAQTYTNAVQIDAAINPGNSGGPLFDETGAVIGITSSIAQLGAQASGSIGIGFAIPSNLATKVAAQLISTGSATHAYLGLSAGDGGGTADGVTRAGALVMAVEADSPAAKAGIKENDVITAIDGKATNQGAALTGFVRQHSANDQVTLTVLRDGQQMEIPVTLSERKDT